MSTERNLTPVPSQAAQWFVRLMGDPVATDTSDSFTAWLAASAENERQFDDRQLAWEVAGDLRSRPGLGALLDATDRLVAARSRERRRVLRTRRWGLGIAAGAAILALGLAAYRAVDGPVVADLQTARGEQRIVILADGSQVMLNTSTRLHTEFSRARRVVRLEEGEALFSVAKDAARPFDVLLFNGVATAVGTQFDVQRDGERATVSVAEGRVVVRTTVERAPSAPVTLGPRDAVEYTAEGRPGAVHPANLQRIEAWKAHRLLFQDVALADALIEYNRYARVPVILRSESLATRRVAGVFTIGDEPAFIHALEQSLPIRAVTVAGQIELVAR
jgi:transmembrane sensor